MFSISKGTVRVDVDGPEPVVAAFRFIDDVNPPVGDLTAATPGLAESYLEPWMVCPFTIGMVLLADQIRKAEIDIEFYTTVLLVTGEQRQVPLEDLVAT